MSKVHCISGITRKKTPIARLSKYMPALLLYSALARSQLPSGTMKFYN
uniref:Uncharacterized protein n=1 Tax=Klebsiella pneumoniae TaxID=573 RepID=A0A8B0SWF1_KLEPN|nr:hypothetical protein [Klebsiella pneumoniae]